MCARVLPLCFGFSGFSKSGECVVISVVLCRAKQRSAGPIALLVSVEVSLVGSLPDPRAKTAPERANSTHRIVGTVFCPEVHKDVHQKRSKEPKVDRHTRILPFSSSDFDGLDIEIFRVNEPFVDRKAAAERAGSKEVALWILTVLARISIERPSFNWP